jgi:hypothetical protein
MASTRKSPKGSAEQALADDEQAFQRQHAQLLRRYEGEYVALRQGRVIAHGSDDEELARRLFTELGDQPFYIAKVEREPTVHEFPSLEGER